MAAHEVALVGRVRDRDVEIEVERQDARLVGSEHADDRVAPVADAHRPSRGIARDPELRVALVRDDADVPRRRDVVVVELAAEAQRRRGREALVGTAAERQVRVRVAERCEQTLTAGGERVDDVRDVVLRALQVARAGSRRA